MKKLSLPRIFLHIEGASVFLAMTFLFFYIKGKFLFYILVFLAPDVLMLGYLINKRIGAVVYNIFHIYLIPLIIAVFAVHFLDRILTLAALAWLAHIGFDRATGMGLKYTTHFKDTHIRNI